MADGNGRLKTIATEKTLAGRRVSGGEDGVAAPDEKALIRAIESSRRCHLITPTGSTADDRGVSICPVKPSQPVAAAAALLFTPRTLISDLCVTASCITRLLR